jgi:hypothetical protein
MSRLPSPTKVTPGTPKPYKPLGFRAAKERVLKALDSGDIQHESRDAQNEKNLLAVGDITVAEVAALIRSCNGRQYESSAHHMSRSVEVHEFLPGKGRPSAAQWYIKFYFRKTAIFISVHE